MPYKDLGEKLGTERGHLVVVAGRPGMGKSVVLLDLARHLSIVHGRRAAFVSLEMMKRQLRTAWSLPKRRSISPTSGAT